MRLTDREADVMRVLWDHGRSSVAAVREALSDRLAYTTVLTILRVLEGKGYVDHEEVGRGYRYFAAVPEEAAQQSAVRAPDWQIVQRVVRVAVRASGI